MDRPVLKIEDKTVGLRQVDTNIFEPKSAQILKDIVNKHDVKDMVNDFYLLNPVLEYPDKPVHIIESFCTVATNEIKSEVLILIYSIRQFHDQPIYVICDKLTEEYLLSYDIKDVILCVDDFEYDPKLVRLNKFHRPEVICKKMDSMTMALKCHSNTFFLDADILVMDSLQENFTSELVLSPQYFPVQNTHMGFQFGFYNAGYLFCANKGFPEWWKHAMINDSVFYEQECLNRVTKFYDIQTFTHDHNYGLWRDKVDIPIPEPVKSWHVHLSDDMCNKGDKITKVINNKMKNFVMSQLYRNHDKHRKLIDYIVVTVDGWGAATVPEKLPSKFVGRLNLNHQTVFSSHRSGWKYAMDALEPLHNEQGILFDGFLENNFAWKDPFNRKAYTEPWVGMFHNPQNVPEWFFGQNSIQNMIQGDKFQESLPHCIGLFALSEYHANYLREVTGKPVSVVYHPTETPASLFNYNKFLVNENKKIVNIGYWLRRLNSIYALPVNGEFEKWRLIPYTADKPKAMIDEFVAKEKKLHKIRLRKKYVNNTKTPDRLTNDEYDQLLSSNIVFLDLYDSSANNAVIECIARTTPILINPIPAVVEYLGKDYPFYFNTLKEAANKVKNYDLIRETHEYLEQCDTRPKLSKDYFRQSIINSEVYSLIDAPPLWGRVSQFMGFTK